jgi:hypothetical protein
MLPAAIQNSTGFDASIRLEDHYEQLACFRIAHTDALFSVQLQGALSALEDALKAGYEDFKVTRESFFFFGRMENPEIIKSDTHHITFDLLQRIRTDPDLVNLRKTEELDRMLKNYDESFINENAINAIKSLFGLGKK